MLGLSEQWRRWIKDALGLTEHIEVLYNPCPMIEPKPELKQKEILFAGTVIPRKGYADLIRRFAKIAAFYPEWKVVFTGNGEIEKAKAIAKEYGIEELMSCQRW